MSNLIASSPQRIPQRLSILTGQSRRYVALSLFVTFFKNALALIAVFMIAGIIDWSLTFPTSQTMQIFWGGLITCFLFLILFAAAQMAVRKFFYQQAVHHLYSRLEFLGVADPLEKIDRLRAQLRASIFRGSLHPLWDCTLSVLFLAGLIMLSPLIALVMASATLMFILLARAAERSSQTDVFLYAGEIWLDVSDGKYKDTLSSNHLRQHQDRLAFRLATYRLLSYSLHATLVAVSFFLSLRLMDPALTLLGGALVQDTLSVGGVLASCVLTFLFLDPFRKLVSSAAHGFILRNRVSFLGSHEAVGLAPETPKHPIESQGNPKLETETRKIAA